jgi:short-subunit dehydrogenase
MSDNVAWITGASSGIGCALAVEYARLGWKVILTSRREEKLQEVKGICAAEDDRVAVLPADLTDLAGIPKVVEKAEALFGKIDLLINNAGQSQRSTVVETEMDVYEHILRLDLLAAIALTKGVLPGMLSRKTGHIAAVTSVAGKFGAPLRSGYSAAKFSLHGFFDALRLEVWKDNIAVSLIVPAFVKTDISMNALTGDGNPYGTMDQNQEEGMSPEDCAKQIVRGLRKKKREFYVALNGRARFALFLNRYFPGLLARILRTARAT